MAVDNPGVIDAIGIARDAVVELTLSDHLEWDEANEHLLLLQEKLNTYLAFVEGGELLEAYPKAAHRAIRIAVVFKHAPTPSASGFLEQARTAIREAGLELTWSVFAAPQSDPLES